MCCVFDSVVKRLLKQFEICLGVFAIFLSNFMEVFSESGSGSALLDIPCMVFQRICMLCM